MKRADVKDLLDAKVVQYNSEEFIATDPIQIPHRFSEKEDIEIAGFLTATIAWGQRTTIINNANKLMEWMDEAPYNFICDFEARDLKPFRHFCHRTFNGADCVAFLQGLQSIYKLHGGLEKCIRESFDGENDSKGSGWKRFKERFFEIDHLPRSQKHLPNPSKGSAAKRMNMFLRWMVRRDATGVDFGIWNSFTPAELYLPLDVHTSRVARKLKLLKRKQDDWHSVEEVTAVLRKMDPIDPIKYDFALFGLGAFEKF